MLLRTVGDLREALAKFPDDMKLGTYDKSESDFSSSIEIVQEDVVLYHHALHGVVDISLTRDYNNEEGELEKLNTEAVLVITHY